jgi:hypothetical protein
MIELKMNDAVVALAASQGTADEGYWGVPLQPIPNRDHSRICAANETVPQNVVKNTFLPFHPGAIRYYREIGIKIPDELAPMN